MTDWAKLKVVDLKAELKKRGLPQHGLKAEMVARLTESDAAPEPEVMEERETPLDQEEENGVDEAEGQKQREESVVKEQGAVELTKTATPEEQGASNIDKSEAPVEAEKTSLEPAQPAQEDEQEQQPQPQPEAQPEPEAQKDEAPAPEPQPEAETETKDASHTEEMAIDASEDSQKRKRRSASPPPDAESIAKRARTADEPPTSDIAPAINIKDQPTGESATEKPDATMQEAPVPEQEPSAKDQPSAPRSSPPRDAPAPEQPDEEMEKLRDVAPSIHPATSALYISNLMRPLRPGDIQTHLSDLATPPGAQLRDDIIVNFHLDQIRTHAFVVFDSTSAASRVRTLLHDCVWPNESNRKALFVDFVPPEKVEGWIETETGGGGRSSTRWEVNYIDNPDGTVEARLESATGSLSRPNNAPPPNPPPMSAPTGPRIASDSANNIPLGPRGPGGPFTAAQPPSGPRAKRSGPGPFPTSTPLPGKRTRTHPVISYSSVPDDLARERIRNMHSFYTDRRGPYGREINRYSFENGDNFVDRGKEIFAGIRPPHRGRGGGGRGGGGGGGRGRGGGFGGGRSSRRPRPRSDRYLPGAESGGGGGHRLSPPPPSSRFGEDRR